MRFTQCAVALLALACLASCADEGSEVPDDPVDAALSDVVVTLDGPAAGAGTISGTGDRMGFNSVGSSYAIGRPDAASSVVIYVIDQPIVCGALATLGWDAKLPPGTQVLELKAIGTRPGSYTVTTSLTPAPGEASVNAIVAGASGPAEAIAKSGEVVLGALSADGATGTFTIQLDNGSLDGSFDAAACAVGREP